MEPQFAIKGIHHITLVSGNPERCARFYVETLGLSFVKKTVNFDQPTTYHLYFGDEVGTPGTLVTFFGWPDAPPGRIGIGTTHHFALTVDSMEALLKWKTYLQHLHVPVAGPYHHQAYSNIIFFDPDGVQLELATRAPGWGSEATADESPLDTWPEPVMEVSPDMRLGGIHHISPVTSDIERTDAFYQDVLGMPLLHKTVDEGAPSMPRWYWSTGSGDAAGGPGGVITYFTMPEDTVPIRGHIGRGLTHHFAFEVESDEAQRYWQERLQERGQRVTKVLDRKYFHSIYFNDPDGHILEIATAGPGFLVDQTREELGKELALPSWLEPQRSQIEAVLPPSRLAGAASAR